MKTKFTISIIIVMAFATIAASPAPETATVVPQKAKRVSSQFYAGFSSFRIHRQGKGVTSTWGMSSESGITCYTLQRTYGDPTDPYTLWDEISVVSCNSSRSYKWTDETVFPGFISYRVMANMSSGGNMMSETETIHIVGH